jgi:hypothetical protein
MHRTVLTCFAYVLVLWVAAVGGERVLAAAFFVKPFDYVPSYRAYPEYSVGVKLRQFAREQRRFDGLFIGNSRTNFGVDPETFDARLRARGIRFESYNLGLPTADPRFWPDFFTRWYTDPAPRHLFLGLLPRDLDRGFEPTGDRFRAAFFQSAGFHNRDLSAVNSWAEEILSRVFVIRGRSSDVHLLSVGDILRGRKLDLEQAGLANGRGWMIVPQRVRFDRAQLVRERRRYAGRHGPRFRPSPAMERGVARLAAWAREHGSCLTLFTTPLLYDRERWGTVEMRRGFEREVRRLARRLENVAFLDVGERVQGHYGLALWAHGDHLNEAGARRFSRDLADALASRVGGKTCWSGRG